MRIEKHGNIEYKLPGGLTNFQQKMYIHLINWKWQYITKDVGYNKYKGQMIPYDALFPDSIHEDLPHIYDTIRYAVKQHQKKYFFKFHEYFYHMASSQAANINLFLPVLLSQQANDIFRLLKHDFKSLAVNELDNGFRIEFWDGIGNEKGILKDHTAVAGTDSDIGIAYYNKNDELCLWLIEHKLTEKEFTDCGGFNSKSNITRQHCTQSFGSIVGNKDLCHYHRVNKYEYWNITDQNQAFFVNHAGIDSCPFKGGMNQLWRNQLLGFALERNEKFNYEHVYFSVVHHSGNTALAKIINQYKAIINNNSKFSVFTSLDVINHVENMNDPQLNTWVEWYRKLYNC
jgi:hypothetical protein